MEMIMYSLKKLFVLPFLIVSLYGCAEMQTTPKTESKSSLNKDDIKRELNEKCLANIEEVEVFQVLNDGALAKACEQSSSYCLGMVVAVPQIQNEELWDKKRIKAPNGKCIVVNGTYKYTSNDGNNRTVPIVGFDYKYYPANEAEANERMEATFNELRNKCLNESINEPNANKEKIIEICECYVDQMGSLSKKVQLSSENINMDTFLEKWIAQSEKICGKSPKKMKWFK